MVDTRVTLSGIELANPVIPASGAFGFGYEFAELYDINILGSISFKGTTKEPRFGNPTPRIAEASAGLLNSVGLQNPGVNKVISEELPKLKKCFNKPVLANVSGFSVEDYAYTCEKLDTEDCIGWFEINISCPNVHGGGLAFGTDPKNAAAVTRAVKKVTNKPVYIKLSPNVTDITEIAKACEAAGADGLSLINTAVKPVALRMVYDVYEAVKIPIIGMGGISTAEDVIEMMLAGARATEVGAANLIEPFACKNIIENLPAVMEKYNIKSLNEIIGGAHNG